jgi:hypothetical protein
VVLVCLAVSRIVLEASYSYGGWIGLRSEIEHQLAMYDRAIRSSLGDVFR